EILDDAVMDHGDAVVHVRVGIALHRLAVRCPARVAEAGVALQRVVGEPEGQVLELALGAAPLQMPVLDGGDAGRVVAAILEPPQRIDEVLGDRLLSQYADDAAHVSGPRLRARLHPMAADGCKPYAYARRSACCPQAVNQRWLR